MSNHYSIYVVDDEQSICDSLKGIFLDEGYHIVTCPDAKTLFEKAAELPPALVLLDIWLPDIDGLEVLTKLRQDFPDTAVIMMSGHAGITSAVTAIKKGASDFLEKPLNMDVLLEKVSNALKTHGEKDVQIHLPGSREKIMPKKVNAGIASLIESDIPQKTLKSNIVLNGTGLMSGRNTGIILSPLGENQGIIFETLDGQRIPAHLTSLENYQANRESLNLPANSTVLVSNGSHIRTVEHLMATLHMFEINNALIKVDEEIPNVDGSAEDFCKLIEETGTVNQRALSKKIVIDGEFIIGKQDENEKYILAEPYDGFEIKMRINYAAPIFEQVFTFNKEKQSFATEIAPARSFNTFENIGMAQKMGKVGGGYLDSHIIIHDGEVINTTLRYPDEFVRHKILDIIGDLYLLGYPLQGKITANMTSHGFNHAFAQKIYEAFR